MRSPAGAPREQRFNEWGFLPVAPRAALTCPGPPQREGGKKDRDRYSDAPRAGLVVALGRGPGLPGCAGYVTPRPQAPHPAPHSRTPPEERPLVSGMDEG